MVGTCSSLKQGKTSNASTWLAFDGLHDSRYVCSSFPDSPHLTLRLCRDVSKIAYRTIKCFNVSVTVFTDASVLRELEIWQSLPPFPHWNPILESMDLYRARKILWSAGGLHILTIKQIVYGVLKSLVFLHTSHVLHLGTQSILSLIGSLLIDVGWFSNQGELSQDTPPASPLYHGRRRYILDLLPPFYLPSPVCKSN